MRQIDGGEDVRGHDPARRRKLDPVWDELFPAEQARLLQLLVERAEVGLDGLAVRLRINGLAGVVREIAAQRALAA